MNDVDSESLRTLADTLKSRLKSGVVVLAAAMPEGKVSLIVTVTPDLAKKAPAGQLVKTPRAHRRRRRRRPSRLRAGGRQGRDQNYRIASGCSKRGHSPAGVVFGQLKYPPDFCAFIAFWGSARKLPIR